MLGRVRMSATVALVAAAACASCSLILGIEDKPFFPDAGPVDADSPVTDAGAECEPAATSCACQRHDFCDDFDVDGQALGGRWSGIPGVSNPFSKGEAGIVLSEIAYSAPRAIRTECYGTKSSSYAVLGHELDHAKLHPGQGLAGVRLTITLRLEALSLTEVRGPLPEAGTAIVGGIMRFEGQDASGIVLLAAEKGAYVYASRAVLETNIKEAGPDDVLVELADGYLRELSTNWLRAEILVADRDRALADGYTTCGTVAPGPVFAASLGPSHLKQGCATLPAGFGGLDWAAKPIVAAGAVLFGGGQIDVRHDDVTFDFLDP